MKISKKIRIARDFHSAKYEFMQGKNFKCR